MFYIGSTSLIADSSQTVRPGVQTSAQQLLYHTQPSSADLSPVSTDTGINDLLAMASLTFDELDCQHTQEARSVVPDCLLGTLFLSVSRTMHCLCLTRHQLEHSYFSSY